MSELQSTEAKSPEQEQDLQFGLAVRMRRAQLAITLDQLAQASGVSPGALSRVERGLLSASLRNALAIARGLDCTLADLLQAPATAKIVRAGEHRRFMHENMGVERLALAQPVPGLSLVQYRVPVGAESSHFAAHRTGTREVFHILEGTLRVWSGADSSLLHTGDTATLSMDAEHRFANEGDSEARFILLVATPSS